MKQKLTDPEKFDPIIENYINGNIAYTKERVKKLSKNDRKLLYQYSKDNSFDKYNEVSHFFFKLI